ncbi:MULTISPECIES: RDD family protein [Mycobacteriaceae]|uniref:RDD family protein n=1 Tax=Mycolicibacillus parakoreensis TaxID=1069221 RepID=A0ABY3U5I1_9MYCO|nr:MULTISPECIES: RDD family protein [Mycobacteriaceae]ULN54149.1 RDD family protein [Mycolicibacillus parakoreensis]
MTASGFESGAPHYPRPGGVVSRFWARVIDGILVNIVAVLLALFAVGDDYPWLVTGLFSGVLMFGYFVLFETAQGATPGKKLLGLSVRGPGGAPRADVKQSAIRNAFTLLPVVPVVGPLLAVLAYLVIGVTISGSSTKQGKHDELAGGTEVVTA